MNRLDDFGGDWLLGLRGVWLVGLGVYLAECVWWLL